MSFLTTFSARLWAATSPCKEQWIPQSSQTGQKPGFFVSQQQRYSIFGGGLVDCTILETGFFSSFCIKIQHLMKTIPCNNMSQQIWWGLIECRGGAWKRKFQGSLKSCLYFFCFGKQHNINFAHPWNMLFVLSVFANTPQNNITLMMRILDTYYLYFLVPQFSKVKPAVFFGYLKQQNKTLNRFADPWDCCLYFLFSRKS